MAKMAWFWRSLCGFTLVFTAVLAGTQPAVAQSKAGRKSSPSALIAHILTLAPG